MINSTVGELYDRCVRYYSDNIAIKYADRSYTYRELGEKSYRLANAFTSLGLGRGEKVAFLMANCPEYLFCEYALAKIGSIRVPLAVLLSTDDHIYMINHSECTALIYHQSMAARIKEMAPFLERVRHYICISENPAAVPSGHLHLQALINNYEADVQEVSVQPEDLCGIYYTGGTTGRPKGVMLSHRAWVNTYITEMLELGLGRNEVFAFVTPLTHAGGCLILPVLLRNGVCLILDHFDPQLFLSVAEKENVTSAFLVPTMIYILLDYPKLKSYDVHSLNNVVYGAAAIAPERLKQAIDTFGPIFTQLYGQTEAPMMISVLPREDHIIPDKEKEKRIFSSCGRPTLPAKVRIVDEEGREVKTGEVGEVIVNHINTMSGYLKNPDASEATVRDGWLYTGDLARQDEEGFLYIVDRSKDMIVSGGFNIYPREVEDALHEHPAVRNAAVVGVPHSKWGEAVKAIVVLHEGQTVTEKDLIAFVKERKGSLVVPKSVEFWDQIPLTNLGKIDKKKIRERFWEGYERRV